MFKSLDIFRMSHAMALHAGARQAAIAQNVANADTPGYRAVDLPPFAQIYKGTSLSDGGPLRSTRSNHLGAMGAQVSGSISTTNQVPDPNGNAVSLEEEMVKAVEVKRQHDRAISIYKSNLGVLRTAIGRG